MLGIQDIKLRYRRSSIGPFWITINMAITIYSMGFLYGHLFKVQLKHYFPFLTSGIICWTFLSTIILESSHAFIESEIYIKNQESFLSLFIMRIVLRNIIILAHNLLVFLPILWLFHVIIHLRMLFFIPNLFIIYINAILWGSLLALIGTRYRDFSQIITSLVQVIFFLTPVMWLPTLLPRRLKWITTYNPFNQFLNLIRNPLLNHTIQWQTFLIVCLITILGFFLYIYFLGKYKHRVVFWL